MGVHDVDGHLRRVPVEGLGEHLEMNAWVFVAGETDVADLAFFPSFESGLHTALLKHPIRIVVVVVLVELPEINVVGLEAAQAFFEIALAAGVVALAVLGHQEDLLAVTVGGEGVAHDFLGATVVIVPSVVEEVDALIDRAVHDAVGFLLVLDRADVPAAEANDRDLLVGAPEPGGRDALTARTLRENALGHRCRDGRSEKTTEEFTPGTIVCHINAPRKDCPHSTSRKSVVRAGRSCLYRADSTRFGGMDHARDDRT